LAGAVIFLAKSKNVFFKIFLMFFVCFCFYFGSVKYEDLKNDLREVPIKKIIEAQ
jgi:hypothetical protein